MLDEDLSRLLFISSSSDYHVMVILLGFLSLAAGMLRCVDLFFNLCSVFLRHDFLSPKQLV